MAASLPTVRPCTDDKGADKDEDGSAKGEAWVRGEIRSLRLTRDTLTTERQSLDVLVNKVRSLFTNFFSNLHWRHELFVDDEQLVLSPLQGKVLTSDEEKRLIELDEAIEAVDAAIEYKNGVICSKDPNAIFINEAVRFHRREAVSLSPLLYFC